MQVDNYHNFARRYGYQKILVEVLRSKCFYLSMKQSQVAISSRYLVSFLLKVEGFPMKMSVFEKFLSRYFLIILLFFIIRSESFLKTIQAFVLGRYLSISELPYLPGRVYLVSLLQHSAEFVCRKLHTRCLEHLNLDNSDL